MSHIVPSYRQVLLRCVLPMLLGFLIYLFLRKPNLLLHQWLEEFWQLPNFYYRVPANTAGRFLLYYLPDLLWVISFSSFLMFVLPYRKSQTTTLGIIFTVALTEAIQVVLPNRFTFDWVDLIISVLTAFIIIKVSKYDAKNRD